MQPSITIVVTCHNYGHFLPACLASLDEQTRRPDQIIVVNDGSGDASGDVLRSRGGSLIHIDQENHGQAGAFNAGFARATGDLVLFLDADDTLAPDAVEILCGAWHPSLAAIGFGLNYIDGDGRLSGYYPVESATGDMRPDLIGAGYFRFMPTSGNVFNRRRIAPGFPLPEDRWRISADAVLLRIAALAGPIRSLPFALGNYRAHGGNSYHRTTVPESRFMRRAVHDMADASLATADLAPDPNLFGSDADFVRLELILAYVKLRLGLAVHGESSGPETRRVWAALPRVTRLRIGLRARAVYCVVLGVLPLCLQIAPTTRRWLLVQDRRPRWLDGLYSVALGSSHQARRRVAHRARWLAPAGPGYLATNGGQGEAAVYNTFDWRKSRSGNRRLLCHADGEVQLRLRHMPYGTRLGFDLKAVLPYASTPIEVAVSKSGEQLARASFTGQARVSIVLEPGETLGEATIYLRISARPRASHPRGLARTLFGPSAVIEVTGLSIEELGPPRRRVMLGLGEVRRFAEIAEACQISPLPDRATGWPDRVEAQRLVLGLVRPNLRGLAEIVLRFGNAQIAGGLVIIGEDGPIYRGRIGPGAEARVPLAPRQHRDDRDFDLSFELDPLDPFEARAFDLRTIGLTSAESTRRGADTAALPLLVPGAIHRFDAATAELLGEGWMRADNEALLFDMLGTLRFVVGPTASEDTALHLSLAPAEILPQDAYLAVAVSAGDAILAQVRLRGEFELVVPLAAAMEHGNRRIELAVHSALSVAETGDMGPRRGGLSLRAVRLSSVARADEPSDAMLEPSEPSLGASIRAAGHQESALRARLDPPEQAEIDALGRARGEIVEGIRNLAGTATQSVLLTNETLNDLQSLGQFAAEADWHRRNDTVEAGLSGLFGSDAAEAIRALALAILTTPPWRDWNGHSADQIHEALRAFPSALARYLCATSAQPRTDAELAAYRSHVSRLYEYARECFLAEPRGSRHDRLAEEILFRLHPQPWLFGPGPLRELGLVRGRAIEAYLLGQGSRITLARAPVAPAPGRLRLGVLLRNLGAVPETWILAGTIGPLPTDAFDVTLYVVHGAEDGPPPIAGARVVSLDGVGVDRAVEAIRAAQLDVLLLGAFFLGYDKLGAIAAHRLAPLQIATTAVSPMTTGLRSFDIMLSSRHCEPPDAAEHYTERLHLAESQVQRFDFGPRQSEPPANRMLARARLGLPPDAVILTSGAMLNKIGDGLLTAWLEVLAAAPPAALVLYPFALNWQETYARRGFERRLRAACAEKGVDPTRVVLLDSMDHATVERVLSLSDVYLDSFPYAGATTVVEALSQRLPVVALAGDTQRGLQGAAWLRASGLDDLVATTPASYVEVAASLANSPGARAAAAAAIRLPDARDAAFRRQFAALLLDLAGAAPERSHRHLFHHMPKAAGTTCRRVFADWFAVIDDDRAPWSLAPPPPPFDLAAIGPGELICGHFNSAGYLLRERYPAMLGDPSWRLITFLRDPLETALSYYFFEREHRPKADPDFCPLDIDAYLETCPDHLGEHLRSIDDDWRVALDRYWFVGTAERLDEGLRWLGDAFGRPVPEEITRLNHAPRTERPSEAAVSAFVQRNAEDFVIYRTAAARSAAILATDPRSRLRGQPA